MKIVQDSEKALKIKILSSPSKENPFAIIYKPANLPSAPLNEDDKNNAFYQASQIFPELLSVVGKKYCEHGLLHRIDTDTKGLLLIASSKESYENLQDQQKNNLFIKTYKAICKYKKDNSILLGSFPPNLSLKEDFLKNKELSLTSYFRPFDKKSRQVRPVTEFSGKAALKKCSKKLYTTHFQLEKQLDTHLYLIKCTISQGYRHQIRSHLSWMDFPIANDKLYDSDDATGVFDFEAYKISFFHPFTKEKIVFEL